MNTTTKISMNRIVKQLAIPAVILTLCAGCGTMKRSSAHAHRSPLANSDPTASAWVSDEADLRKDYLEAIRQDIARYELATNALEQAKQAEEVIRVTEEALQLKGWKSRQKIQIKNQRVTMLKARDSAIAIDCSEQARPYIQERQDYDKAIQSLDEMMHLCRRFSEAKYWNQTEKRQWLEQAKLLQEMRAKFIAEFADATASVQAALLEAQKKFVNSQAAQDLTVAQALFDAQDNKWFNWTILGHFRDDAREFAKAVQLCDRVLGDPRTDTVINHAAATQRARRAGRLGTEGWEVYHASGSLPSYSKFADFPNPSPEEIHRECQNLWREKAIVPVQPLDVQPGAPQPALHLGPIALTR